MAAGQHRDRSGGHAGAMGSGIDAARQARYDAIASVTEVVRQCLARISCRRLMRCASRRWRPAGCEQSVGLASQRDQRRCIIDGLQTRRIIRLAESDKGDAVQTAGLQFGLGFFHCTNMRAGCAAAAGEFRQILRARGGRCRRY